MDAQNENSGEPPLKRVGRFAVVLLFILIISGALFTFIAPFIGWRIEVVISGSMEPAIQTGSVVIVRPIAPENIREGDIIMYSSPAGGILTTHRVIKVDSENGLTFLTKGDANKNADINPLIPSQIVGIVAFIIPFLGYLIQFIKTPLGFIIFLLIPAAILIANEVLYLWREME